MAGALVLGFIVEFDRTSSANSVAQAARWATVLYVQVHGRTMSETRLPTLPDGAMGLNE